MTRRNQIASALLAFILLLLAYVIYSNFRQPGAVVVAISSGQAFVPLAVENPALRIDLLEQLRRFEYQGPRRNIFSTQPLPVEVVAPQFTPSDVVIAPSAPLPSSPPLVVTAVFFGHVTDRGSGARRAFFSEGEEVYVLGLGEVLLSRYRLLQIGNNTAELEEVASGRRTTLTMQENPG
jgi:hypothetical protein